MSCIGDISVTDKLALCFLLYLTDAVHSIDSIFITYFIININTCHIQIEHTHTKLNSSYMSFPQCCDVKYLFLYCCSIFDSHLQNAPHWPLAPKPSLILQGKSCITRIQNYCSYALDSRHVYAFCNSTSNWYST